MLGFMTIQKMWLTMERYQVFVDSLYIQYGADEIPQLWEHF